MTRTTLLARLYKFIVESRCVRLTDLKGRFPEEFTEHRDRFTDHRKRFTDHPVRRTSNPHVSDPHASGKEMGRLSQRLSDALRFLLAKEVIFVNRRGRLVHVSAMNEKSKIRLERACLGGPEIPES